MRQKCKQCREYEEHICSIFDRGRSSGKKRFCRFFNAKPESKREKPKTIYLPHRDKKDIKRERMKTAEDLARLKDMEKKIDQRKLVEAAMLPSSYEKKSVTLKRPNLFKRMFQKVIP